MQTNPKKAGALAHKLRRSIATVQAVLTFAKTKKISVPSASAKFGKTRNYVSCAMFWLRAAEKKNGVTLPEIARLEQDIVAVKILKKKKKLKATKRKYSKRATTPMNNALSHITEAVEFKYPVITDRPVTKIVETYPLRALQPGHAFAVPARKGEMMAAKKALTLFAKRNPAMRFLQQKEKNEFVTWRTK